MPGFFIFLQSVMIHLELEMASVMNGQTIKRVIMTKETVVQELKEYNATFVNANKILLIILSLLPRFGILL